MRKQWRRAATSSGEGNGEFCSFGPSKKENIEFDVTAPAQPQLRSPADSFTIAFNQVGR